MLFGVVVVGAALADAPGATGLLHLPLAEVEITEAQGQKLGARLPVRGPWRLVGVTAGVRSYEAPLPIRTRALFFDRPPQGMALWERGRPLTYGAFLENRSRASTWEFNADSVTVRVRPGGELPGPDSIVLLWEEGSNREASLYLGSSGLEPKDFVVRSLQVDDVTRRGAYLPAPSMAAWDVQIPEGGTLELRVGLIPPEVDDGRRSDGSNLDLTVNGELVSRWRVSSRGFHTEKADLGAWAGQTVRLGFTTDDADVTRDHVFVTDPRIYVPSAPHRQVVLVFVDTLRRDHLSQYGYKRDTTPFLDSWSKTATVFDDARTIAPWTLPSTRALLTGREPEFWDVATPIQRTLASKGWATASYVGNVYLSSNFEMGGDWGEHGCINWPYAGMETWRAKKFLDAHQDQDSLVLVHYMDLHLPYKEPWSYQNLYVDNAPAGLSGAFNRNTLMAMSTFNREPIRRYLIDRYDQNLRYIDDELRRLMQSVREDAAVVFFSDHGEEFFDHGSLEHGHTLYDELLRVPLMMRLPGVAPRQVDARVSLLDVVPTLYEWLGLAPERFAGKSLLPLATNGADPALDGRELAFGRTLYNGEAWGSLVGDQKYITGGGREQLYDVAKDPGESRELVSRGEPTDAAIGALARALNRPVHLAFRVIPSGRIKRDYTIDVHVPGGIKKAFIGSDATKITSATMESLDSETVRFHFTSDLEIHREAFVVPERPPEEIVDEVHVKFVTGSGEAMLADRGYDGTSTALARVRSDGRSMLVNYAVVPEPVGVEMDANDAEMAAALGALGYLDPAPPEGEPSDAPKE